MSEWKSEYTSGFARKKAACICIFKLPNMSTINNIKAILSCWIFIIMSAILKQKWGLEYLAGPVIYHKLFNWNAAFCLADSYFRYDHYIYIYTLDWNNTNKNS